MAHFIHVVLQGRVYSCYRRIQCDDTLLHTLSQILGGIPQESLFDALYRGFSTRWITQHDIPHPFGDKRENRVASSWVIDLDNNLVTLRKKDAQVYQTQLHKVQAATPTVVDMPPQAPTFAVADMLPLEEPSPFPLSTIPKAFGTPSWQPRLKTDFRTMAFAGRILKDFAYQWRHVLRSRYNWATFHKMACAIVNIVTLDFTVREIENPQGTGPVVRLSDLPQWKTAPEQIIFRLDRVTVVLCQHFAHAMESVCEDLGKRRIEHETEHCLGFKYLVISVREVFLYEACVCGHHSRCTKPERLFNGVDEPTEQALAYLFTTAPCPAASSTLHKLPIEVQDMILEKLSAGHIVPAKVGVLFSLGSLFRWQVKDHTVGLQTVFSEKPYDFPPESQVWFGDYMSGVVYN